MLNLELSDDFESIVERGYDLAIRVGALESSGLTAVRLAPVRRVLCARQGYLDAAGRPQTSTTCAAMSASPRRTRIPGGSSGRRGPCTVSASGPLRTHSNEVVREAVLGGLGIALRSTWDVHAELRDGSLEVVLPAYAAAASAGIFAVYPSRPSCRPRPGRSSPS